MSQTYHVVTYEGPFGFIKPWTAVRDGLTYSQTFLSPSTVEGMRIKLGVSAILRHRLRHGGINAQQEHVHAAGWKGKNMPDGKAVVRSTGVITRGVLLRPSLTMAFASPDDAERAATDHLCLCRNEDLVFPVRIEGALVREMEPAAFNEIVGFEMRPEDGPGAVPLGVSRYTGQMMRGRLEVVGDPGNAPSP